MTDDISARAHPPGEEPEPADRDAPLTVTGGPAPSERGSGIAPAAQANRTGAIFSPGAGVTATAVLESKPLLGFPGELGPGLLGARTYPEPPPFGFNAPPRTTAPEEAAAEHDTGLGAARDSSEWRPTSRPPAAAPTPRPTAPPRELMPSSIPVYRPRIGEGTTPTFGPPGRRRSVAAMVIFSVLTLGFYAVAWHRRVNREMGDFDPRVHVDPGRSAWAVALPLLVGLLATAAAAARVLLAHFGVAVHVPVSSDQALYGLAALAAVPYLVLVMPFSVVAVAMTAERVRVVEEHAGITADEQIRPAGVVGWLLLPLLGGFVGMGRQQRRLNHIWDLARE